MRRFALLALSLVLTFTALVIVAPLSEAIVLPPRQSTAAQLDTGGNVFDQIGSLLNNFTKRFDINPLAPQQTVTPSVKITAVKIANSGQSAATPQVIVALQNGKVALDGVRVDVVYKNTAGANVLSDSTVVALKSDEARSITFTPKGLSGGSYVVGVVVYKNGTDPSNQATPAYDAQQNAATFTIASPTPAGAGAGKAVDPGSQTSNVGDILSLISPWMYFIIAMTGLITIALFFVFSQNRSGEDRYEDDHFKGDGYAAGGSSTSNPPPLSSAPPTVVDRSDDNMPGAISGPRRSRRIEVTAPEGTSEESGVTRAKNPPRSTEHVLQFDADGFVVGDVTSKKALRNKIRGKRGA
ncbi:MAG: hypothetical protein WBZ42_00865 [Halobacteriota archaeon]